MSTEYLFTKFLKTPEEYDNARNYWQSLCDRVLKKHGQAGPWKEIPPGSLPDDRDGNPIYAGINYEQLKSVVIIQQDPEIHRKWEIAAWVNIFGDELSEPGPINEFVFACNLTVANATTFETLFEMWIQPKCQVPDIQEKIEELISPQEQA